MGRPPEYDKVDLTLRATKLKRAYPKATQHGIVTKLRDQLRDEGLKTPAKSGLQKIVNQVFDFE